MYRVMVVDDEEFIRKFMVAILTAKGYEVVEAREGREALLSLEALDGRVDVIVTDVVMPGMDGLAMIAAVREKYPHIPCIIVTGALPEGRVATDCRILRKPFQNAHLFEVIKSSIHEGHRSSQRE